MREVLKIKKKIVMWSNAIIIFDIPFHNNTIIIFDITLCSNTIFIFDITFECM